MSVIADAIEQKKKQLPQFDYMWRVVLPELGTAGFKDHTGSLKQNVANAAINALVKQKQVQGISHRVFSIDIPYTTWETVKNTFGQKFFYTAGNHDIGTVSLKIDEYEDGDSLRYFLDWQQMMLNSDGSHNPPAFYKKDFVFIKMSASGLDLHTTIYRDCFPTEISPSSFSYDSNGITQYSVTLTGDSVEHLLIPAEDVIAAVRSIQPDIINGASLDSDGANYRKTNYTNAVIGQIINKVVDFLF